MISLPVGLVQKLLQPSISNQLLQMIPKIPIVLDCVSLILVVLAIKALVAIGGVPCHLIWPFEVWLTLDFLQNLMYWLLEYHVNHLRSHGPRLPGEIPPRSVMVVSV